MILKTWNRLSVMSLILGVFFVIFMGGVVVAQEAETQAAQPAQETSITDKVQWVHGPGTGELDQWAKIEIPQDYVFAGASDTRLLMESMGNPVSNTEVGFFGPNTLEWFVVFEFSEVGYIKDDDKDALDADAMLESMKKSTEAGNQVRKEKGWPGLTIVGWEVAPQYNESTHNLEWAIKAKEDNGNFIINHNTRLLGRHGVMKSTLVVAPESFSTVLGVYNESLNGFSFSSGQKYAEFIKGDKVAKYGLAALVAGGAGAAAAKLGIFKILGKYIKFILIGIAAFFAAIWNKVKRLFSSSDIQVRQDLE